MTAQQGHKYLWRGWEVLAMSAGPFPRVAYLYDSPPWTSPSFEVSAADLVPLPMVYFHGQTPSRP